MGNTFKTAFLLTLLTLLLMFIGRAFGGQNGMILALGLAVVMNFVSYFYSDKIALTMYRAQPVSREELPRAYAAVERLTQKIGIPMPKMYVIPTESPNAFATGRNPQHASVAVTQGILNLLNDEELEGVLAHELGHVNNRDILISSVAATLAGAITMLSRFGFFFGGGRDDRRGGGIGALLMLILAPFAAMLIQLWVSRTREYDADATGAHFTGNPYALAQRSLEAGCLRAPSAHAGHTFNCASVHHSAISGDEFRQSVLHSSSHCQTHRAADGKAGRVLEAVTSVTADPTQLHSRIQQCPLKPPVLFLIVQHNWKPRCARSYGARMTSFAWQWPRWSLADTC
jgi:heat shock protein HtpX